MCGAVNQGWTWSIRWNEEPESCTNSRNIYWRKRTGGRLKKDRSPEVKMRGGELRKLERVSQRHQESIRY